MRSFKAFDECVDKMSADHVFRSVFHDFGIYSALCKSPGADLYLCAYHFEIFQLVSYV